MIELQKHDFLNTQIINIKKFGTTFSINEKYGKGYYWNFKITQDCIIAIHKIKFNQESLLEYILPDKYVFSFYLTGAGDEFYPYQSISPNMLRFYEPTEKYKVIYHPQVELSCLSIELSTFFIEQYLKEQYIELNTDLSSFFKRKNKFFLPKINKILYDIYNHNGTSSPELYLTSKIYEVLSEFCSLIDQEEFFDIQQIKVSDRDVIALEEIIKYMDEHYNFNMSLETLSKIACMSVSKMKKLFKDCYNMTITEHIQRKRMSVAEHLLISTPLTINEISKIVGYSNPSRFTELFNRYYGFNPSKYRR